MPKDLKKRSARAVGTCKLTGKDGPFVNAHLIPKAVTKPAEPGRSFIQGSPTVRPERRHSSWYDNRLVTRYGEDILRDYDTWAIRELRRHRLIWSSWGSMQRLGELHTEIPGTPWGFREIYGIDPGRFRLFFLSLLWRAAASERWEFAEVSLPPNDLERLRYLLVERDPGPLDFYPASLTQLSTRGPEHNQTPFVQTKLVPAYEGMPERHIPMVRFYFDGLAAHVHLHASDEGETAALSHTVVGAGPRLSIGTVPYETSFQRENLDRLIVETSVRWPDVMRRLDP